MMREFELSGYDFGLMRRKVGLFSLVSEGGIEFGDLEKYRVSFQKCVDWGGGSIRKRTIYHFCGCKVSGEDLCKKEV